MKNDKVRLGLPSSAAVILQLFKPELSVKGSNQYIKETEAVALCRDFIQEMEENDPSKLQDFLAVATGMKSIPPLGYQEMAVDINKNIPFANTCINKFTIHCTMCTSDG